MKTNASTMFNSKPVIMKKPKSHESIFKMIANVAIDLQVVILLLRSTLEGRMSKDSKLQLKSDLLNLGMNVRLIGRIVTRMIFILQHYSMLVSMRDFIIEYVRINEYYAPYKFVMDKMFIQGEAINHYLIALGDLDQLEGRPRTDALVGNDGPSDGYNDEEKSVTKNREAHEATIADLCNYHGFKFKYYANINGVIKGLYRTKGMNWYKQSDKSRGPVERHVESVKLKVKRKNKHNHGRGPASALVVVR